ncbi:MAG: leucyl aminopeptidase [Deltaproteobacteria bacterium]|nr:MAG: leucyl aminopeptidase [Deltaproteobacteria bacterium]
MLVLDRSPTVAPNVGDTIAVAVTPESLERAIDRLEDPIATAIEHARFDGKPGKTFVYTRAVEGGLVQVALVGVDGTRPSLEELRVLAHRAGSAACTWGSKRLVLDVSHLDVQAHGAAAGARLAEGAILSTYAYRTYLSEERARRPDLGHVTVCGPEIVAEGFEHGRIVADGIARARDLGNGPAELVTPDYLADTARDIAKAHADAGVEVEILDREACAALGMGLFLAVAKGSDVPPRFIHLSYRPSGAKRRVVLVGKGVTFDSGGYSLKPTDAMLDMKMDMCGAAAVIGAFEAIVRLGLPVEVHALVAATENMIGGHAYRLGDVYRGLDGTTVEINNTDAEGRLTLADAIAYGRRLSPDAIFDLATLTGACMVALGPRIAGLMTPDDGLADQIRGAADVAGERIWRLPLPKDLEDQLDSKIADCKNTGERWGGALTAGLFLARFAKDTPWAHLDIAGPAMASKAWGAHKEGATGFGVATVVELVAAMGRKPV